MKSRKIKYLDTSSEVPPIKGPFESEEGDFFEGSKREMSKSMPKGIYEPTSFTPLFIYFLKSHQKLGHIHCFCQKRNILSSPSDCSGQRDQGLQSGTVPPKAGRMVSLVMRYIASVRHAKRIRNCMHLTSCKLGIFLYKRVASRNAM
uniref:Uncharacterized protein n=1 Tax=Cacopsylla melanoneura TaxID=428564 RepID=A0A8D8USR9_9HEMI